ncbi:MAG: hypothetical protein ABIW47_09065 [Ginsengibacter sp.]|jgi:16S rRNA G966 N2-methylase RsmD
MRNLSYFKYFLFLSKHWNIRLAYFTIKHEIAGEKKYGIQTTGIDKLKRLSVVGDNKINASIYQAANYYLLEKAFNFLLEEKATGTIVDFGSGKGRIMAVAASYGFTKIKGIEFAAALNVVAKKNIDGIQSKYPEANFTILTENAVKYEVDKEDSIFFFFNPFDEKIVLEVVKNIMKSLRLYPRKIFVVYLNPMHKEIFESAGFFEEYYVTELEYLELSVLTYLPD